MRRTTKWIHGIEKARELFTPDQIVRELYTHEALYSALESRGFFWEAESSAWTDQPKSTSMFESDAGLPTGVFRLRVMAHPGEIEEVIKAVREGLHEWGVKITEESGQYPNRRGPGVRVYLSCQVDRN